MALISMQMEIERIADDQPGLAELMHRAYANIKEEDFEAVAATIYARNLSYEDLKELAYYAEKPAVNRWFRVIFSELVKGAALNERDIIRQFDADEIVDIMRFSQSESFARMTKALPKINRELSLAGKELGESVMKDYIKQH
ncbi:MAG: hypothetical protein KDI30_09450 [Pseudomonadales bacterium]|nr:hypothetical protein [Pseudomonadales bacterium]